MKKQSIWTAFRFALAAGIVLLAPLGCGSRKYFPVHGKVVFKDDTVLTGGWVTFEPLDPGVRASATGTIQPDGTFQLTTETSGDGAAVGRYRVTVSPPPTRNMDENKRELPVIHTKYQSFDKSPLEVEVKPDRNPEPIILRVEPP